MKINIETFESAIISSVEEGLTPRVSGDGDSIFWRGLPCLSLSVLPTTAAGWRALVHPEEALGPRLSALTIPRERVDCISADWDHWSRALKELKELE